MRKLIIVLLLLFAPLVLFAEDCICYYFNYIKEDVKMFYNTCQYYNRVIYKALNITCKIIPYAEVLNIPRDRKKALIFVGHGNPLGLYLTYNQKVSEHYIYAKIYEWRDLVPDINASVVIIDACFSGYAQDYFMYSNIDTFITSTYKENSWYICDKYNGYKIVSSLAVALRCRYDDEYVCPIRAPFFGNCPNMTINECQLQLIIDALSEGSIPDFYDWEMPSIGTCVLNNMPCSYYLH